ncbi:MAG: NAD-dependent epimerase/dehydratase family protein [Nevskiaceae bacterium]|nr:MAG: NAD-dependent epimerase/dehydratase family protein [Nevskiaceae bacterium]
MARIALVAGATGLVGQHLVQRLLVSGAYDHIKLLTRRPLAIDDGRIENVISDYADLAALGARLQADDVFCCLGTTLRKAGSRAAFEDVDYRMVLDLARAARAQGARQFLVVSAAGTAEHSPSFYSRVKAKMERDVAAVGFDAVHILRPSLLLGARDESRPAEAVSQWLMPLFNPLLVGGLRKYRAIRGEDVAEAMLQLARRETRGVHIHHLPLDA